MFDEEPVAGDIVLSDSGPLGSRTMVSQYGLAGDIIGTYDVYDDAVVATKIWMEQHQFWPDVWTLSDHGNYCLTAL